MQAEDLAACKNVFWLHGKKYFSSSDRSMHTFIIVVLSNRFANLWKKMTIIVRNPTAHVMNYGV